MAKYLFCWELGQGLGHLVRYRASVDKLIAEGHDVHYLARDERRVRLVNPQKTLQVTEIQPEFIDQAERIRQPASASPATLLNNCGFFSAERLAARAQEWMQWIMQIKPDCIVADHSPTAVFANKFLGVPLILSGNGFTAPPAEKPFRLFQYWRFSPNDDSIRFETQVTQVLNEAAKLLDAGNVAFEHPCELFQGEQRWLMTFAEFDCYGPRANCDDYMGTFVQQDFGEEFVWPRAPGPKVFAYLSKTRGLDYLAEWARVTEASVCLCGVNLPPAALQGFDSERIYFAGRAVKLRYVFQSADLAITNGSANTVANFALAGIPQLALPQSVENLMEARRLEILGCGLIANLSDAEQFGRGLNALVANRDFRRAARRLQQKYQNQDEHSATELLYNQLLSL